MCINCFLSYIRYPVDSGLLVPMHTSSQGEWVQASYPSVETAINPFYPQTDCSAQFFRVADLAHEAMLDGLPTTKRYRYAGQFEHNIESFLQRPLLQGRPSIQEAKCRGQGL